MTYWIESITPGQDDRHWTVTYLVPGPEGEPARPVSVETEMGSAYVRITVRDKERTNEVGIGVPYHSESTAFVLSESPEERPLVREHGESALPTAQ